MFKNVIPNEIVPLEEWGKAALKMPCILDTPLKGKWRFELFYEERKIKIGPQIFKVMTLTEKHLLRHGDSFYLPFWCFASPRKAT